MKTNLRPCFPSLTLLIFFCAVAGPLRAEDEIEKAFRDALYAEEVKGDTETALKAYQEVGAKFETQRDMAATALFRQGECLRKLGRKDEAAALYNKVLAQYGDKERVAKLSRENLAALGQPAAGTPTAAAQPAGMTEEEAKELTRLKAMAKNSPDLLLAKQGNDLTPLEFAAQEGFTEIMRWLLSKIPQPSPALLAGPLDRAANHGHLKVCELLLDAGADVNAGAPLIGAVLQKRLAVVRLLLARKADPNATGRGKAPGNPVWDEKYRPFAEGRRTPTMEVCTPLVQAALDDQLQPELISELLAAGADVNRAARVEQQISGKAWKYPVTPLSAAVIRRNAAKVRLLLAAKADVNQTGGDLDSTPLLLALMGTYPMAVPPGVAPRMDDEIVVLLIAAGADWKARLSTGATALHIAARRGLATWVDAALKAGLDASAVDENGAAPLHFAAESGSLECVQKLLAAGAKVDTVTTDHATTDDWKVTPLAAACRSLPRTDGGLQILRALLDAGANPNAKGPYGTALSFLLPPGNPDWCWPEAVMLLMERGARPADSGILDLEKLKVFRADPRFPDSAQSPQPSPKLLAAFRTLWKAANWRDNPRLPHAVWLDDGEAPLRNGTKSVFSAMFCDDSALTSSPSLRHFLSKAWWWLEQNPGIRRDWTKVTVTRVKDGKEEVIPVDVLALIAEAEKPAEQGSKVQIEGTIPGDFVLQWGDAVSIPATENTDPAPSERVKAWSRQDLVVKVRIELPGGSLVTNAVAGGEPLWISTARSGGENYPTIDRAMLLQQAGLSDWPFKLTLKHKHMNEAGIMDTLANPMPSCYHGDILTLEPPASSAKMSENALRAGIWLCQSMDGPFWEIPARTTTTDESAPLGGLLLALLGPHPLPVPLFDWDKALVRRWQSGEPTGGQDPFAQPAPKLPAEWTEDKLLTVWPDCKLEAGTVLILPATTADGFEPPAELRAALAKQFSLNWQMKIGRGPLLDSRWEPRLFRAENQDGRRIWRDLDPGTAGSPVVPSLENLLRAHPSAGEFKMTPVDSLIEYPRGSFRQLHDFTAWLIQSGSQLQLPAADPPAQATPAPADVPRRRTVLPTAE